MMCAFPLLTQDVIFPTESKKKKVRKLTKAQINKRNQKALRSETLRRIHLYELKKKTFEVVKGECYYLEKCIDKHGVLCGAGSVFCKTCFIPIHEKCVINSKLQYNGVLFCSTECSVGQKLTNDKAAHFMNISSNVFKFGFDFRNVRIVFMLSTNCTVNSMKNSIQFNIRSSHADCKDLVVNRIIVGGKILSDSNIKDTFKTKEENYIKIMCSNSLQITNNSSNITSSKPVSYTHLTLPTI